jgi:hypothetical protein
MKTRRERKHPRIAVSGDLHADRHLPPWEIELSLAALARLAAASSADRPERPEVTDAAR